MNDKVAPQYTIKPATHYGELMGLGVTNDADKNACEPLLSDPSYIIIIGPFFFVYISQHTFFIDQTFQNCDFF